MGLKKLFLKKLYQTASTERIFNYWRSLFLEEFLFMLMPVLTSDLTMSNFVHSHLGHKRSSLVRQLLLLLSDIKTSDISASFLEDQDKYSSFFYIIELPPYRQAKERYAWNWFISSMIGPWVSECLWCLGSFGHEDNILTWIILPMNLITFKIFGFSTSCSKDLSLSY